MKRVKISDIAKVCSVSVGTVSRALAGDQLINIDTRERIKKVADELGYVPNVMARSLSRKNNKIIGIVIPDITNPFFAEVAKSIEMHARENDFSIFLCNTNLKIENEKKYIDQLYSYDVNGVIIVPVSFELEHIISRYSPEKNLVFLTSIPDLDKANYVITDDEVTIDIAINYLVNIGHEKIAYVGGEENVRSNLKRREAYFKSLEEKNLKPILLYGGEKNYSNNSNIVEELKNDFIFTKNIPTAIIAYNDNLALKIIQAIEELGLRVPEDISVVGIDDIMVSGFHKIELTTVSQPKVEIGRRCAEIIIDKMTTNSKDVIHEVFKPRLIVRKTTLARK